MFRREKMRYIVWGPLVGLVIGCLAFLLGMFGFNGNLFIGTTACLVIIGLAIGWYADGRIK